MPFDTRSIIKEPASALWKNAENPDVFVDIFGVTHVVWVAETLSGVKRIFYIFDDGNLNFDPINTTLIGDNDRNSNNPRIAVNRSGRVLIIYEVENLDATGSDIFLSDNDGTPANSLALSEHISRNSGTGKINRSPRIVINDETKDPHFVWLGVHNPTGKIIPLYTKRNATTLIATVHEVTPDVNYDCDNIEIALIGNLNQVIVSFEQIDNVSSKTNIRLSQGDQLGFVLLGDFVDGQGYKILNRPSIVVNNKYPQLAVNPRIYEITEAPTTDDDPSIIVVWEDDDSPNHIRFAQRYQGDFADGTIATSGVHRPGIGLTKANLVQVVYYKATGSNNVVNLSYKEIDSNVWTEANDISNGHAFGDGIYNIRIICSGCDHTYIAFKTGPSSGPQRVVHLNNFRTNSLFSFDIFAEELNSPSDTRSHVAMHLDDKVANRILASDAPSRAALVFTDYTVDFEEPDGIGDVHVFGGVVSEKPVMISVKDEDGDNKPEFKWFLPGEYSEGFFDIYYKLCGASGIVPYEQDVMLTGVFSPSGIDGHPEPGYIFSHEAASGIDFAELYGFGVRKCQGPWSDEFCFRLGDISVSNPTIIPPENQIKVEKCDVITLGGSAEPGSTIESQTIIEYSDPDGLIEINRTVITDYQIDPQGNYSGTLTLGLLPNTASIRSEVIARDSEGNLSVAADSVSNLLVVQNIPPVLVSVVAKDQNTCSTEATNSLTVNVSTVVTGDVFEIKVWEDVSDGGTGEVGASWITYAETVPFTFANNTNEIKTIYVKVKDSCGNESATISATIEYDTTPPQLLAATLDPATRTLILTFSEPIKNLNPSKIRIVKGI